MINVGEGIRRAPEFLATMFRENDEVVSVEDCRLSDRRGYASKLWAELESRVMAKKRPAVSRTRTSAKK
jgi:hypothetical protein